jgi:DNA-binding CsgD family transcriptional regulator
MGLTKNRIRSCNCEAAHLTTRHIEILELIAAGMRSQDIAGKLGISSRTVQSHLAVMRHRAEVESTLNLIVRCCASGMLVPVGGKLTWSGLLCLKVGVGDDRLVVATGEYKERNHEYRHDRDKQNTIINDPDKRRPGRE